MTTVEQILNFELDAPAFSYRPSTAAPVGRTMSFGRSSNAWVFTPQQNFVKKEPGEARIRGGDASILLETQASQILDAPDDLSANIWGTFNTTINAAAGTAMGQSYAEVRETTDDSEHIFNNSGFATSEEAQVSATIVFRPVGRDYFEFNIATRNNNNDFAGSPQMQIDTSASDPKDWVGVVDDAANSTMYIAKVESLWRDWAIAKMGFNIDSGSNANGYNMNFDILKSPNGNSYSGDPSKGVDVMVANVINGRYVPVDPIFDISNQSRDELYFDISATDWNDKEGAYYFEFTPRTSYANNGRIFNAYQAEIYIRNSAPPYGIVAFDRRGSSQFLTVSDSAKAYEKNKVLITFRDNGDWGMSVNGEDTEKYNQHGGEFLKKPNGQFTRSGRQGAQVLHDFRYIPSWIPKRKRKIATA